MLGNFMAHVEAQTQRFMPPVAQSKIESPIEEEYIRK